MGQTVEQAVKSQFAKTFKANDWRLFKRMAEFYLRRAAFLRMCDVDVDDGLKLLARNCQKRLFIGIGTELLLKAIYLKKGFLINKLENNQPGAPGFPFTSTQARGFRLLDDKTYMLNELIDKLHKIMQIDPTANVLRGLKIAKVFRNKEGHVVTPGHRFDESNYSDVEKSLASLYDLAFNETLRAKFSIAEGEKGLWKVS